MATTYYRQSDDIDLGSLWQAILRSLPRLILLGALLAGLAYAVLMLVAPRYMSEAQLAIESKSTTSPFTDPSRGGASDSVAVRMDKEAINTHVRALMSTDLAATIVRELKLADRPEFNSARGTPDRLSALLRLIGIGAPRAGETDQDRAIAAYMSRLEVYSPKESRFIGIRFTSIDPELAAAVANRLAETYRESLAHQTLNETDEVQKALEPKIARLADEAAAAEAEVEKFRGAANIFKGGQQATGLNEQQLAELNAELIKVKTARSEAEARAHQAREMQGLGSAETLADVQKSPLIQNLVQSRVRVERQISELSATLLPGHPRMRQLAADLKGLKAQIAAEVDKIVDGMDKEAKVAALREDAIGKSVDEIKSRIVNAGPEEAKLRSLEADARSKRAELDRLRAQFEANRVRADDSRAIPVEAQIVSSARPSTVPVFPKKGPIAFLVAAAAVLMGLALVVTRGLLSGARVPGAPRRARPMRERRLPALPVLPLRREAETAARAHEPRTAADIVLSMQPPAQEVEPEPDAETGREADPDQPRFDLGEPVASEVSDAEPSVPDASDADHAAASEGDPAKEVSGDEPMVEPVLAEPGAFETEAVTETARAPLAPIRALASVADLANCIEALRLDNGNGAGNGAGARTLLVGSDDMATLAREAHVLCRLLAGKGATVVLIDWSLNGVGVAGPLGVPASPGFSELLEGQAGFEDVVHPLSGGHVHMIPSGEPLPASAHPLDGGSLNFLLDALDTVYEHIVVASRADPARRLFEVIEGRFDCGAVFVEDGQPKPAAVAEPGSFLGFEVEGIALFTVEAVSEAPHERFARAG